VVLHWLSFCSAPSTALQQRVGGRHGDSIVDIIGVIEIREADRNAL
jgi:hypothetical protein